MMSPSSQRAWIEIRRRTWSTSTPTVALLAEGVDRNVHCLFPSGLKLLSPSSQRAWIEIRESGGNAGRRWSPSSQRAWIEIPPLPKTRLKMMSPSSQRAWIEILRSMAIRSRKSVALLAEGVDRNFIGQGNLSEVKRSPSSQRAWIEIFRTA